MRRTAPLRRARTPARAAMSSAVTAPAPARAAATARNPVPVQKSRTRAPGAGAAARSASASIVESCWGAYIPGIHPPYRQDAVGSDAGAAAVAVAVEITMRADTRGTATETCTRATDPAKTTAQAAVAGQVGARRPSRDWPPALPGLVEQPLLDTAGV